MSTSLTPEQRDVIERIRSGRPQRPLTPEERAEVVERVRRRMLPGKRPGALVTIADTASLKRIAWAYGCAKKGSDEERQLRELLVEKVKAA